VNALCVANKDNIIVSGRKDKCLFQWINGKWEKIAEHDFDTISIDTCGNMWGTPAFDGTTWKSYVTSESKTQTNENVNVNANTSIENVNQ
jgi:hypothetical protein